MQQLQQNQIVFLSIIASGGSRMQVHCQKFQTEVIAII